MKTKFLFLCGILAFFTMTATYAQDPFKDNKDITLTRSTSNPKSADIKIVPKRGMTGGQEGADLGLSVLWATSNIDANNAGGYYGRIVAWGELNEKSSYTKANSEHYDRPRSDISGNYIFLPAVGINRSDSITEMNKRGYYWTSTPAGSHTSAYHLSFDENGINILEGSRFEGCYIRAVRSK